jgi:LacI family transcriptional regulator
MAILAWAGNSTRLSRTDVLLHAGHRRIGYINGEPGMEASRHGPGGYRQALALALADLPFDPTLGRQGNWQPLLGYEGTRADAPARLPPYSAQTI